VFALKGTEDRLSVVFAVLTAAQSIAAAAILLFARKDLRWPVSFRFDSEMLRTIGFLGLGNVVIILTMRIDVFIIKHYLDYQHLGYYHVVFSLCSVFPLLTGSVMTVLLREFSSDGSSSEDHKLFLARQLKLVVPGIVLTTVLVLLARPAIELLFGQRYAMSISLLQVMIIPFSLGVVFTPLESYYYSRRPHVITVMKFLQMTATIVFSLLFIRTYGLIGAGYSALLVRMLGWTFLVAGMMLILGKTRPAKDDPGVI
jgi:O-antigen/teichoic acid export membrane protein